jgi:hypothetical protein
MLNKLDGKVIVDRKTVEALDKFARRLGFERGKAFVDLRKALSQDTTGWAAVPVLSTIQMDVAGSDEMLGDEFAGLDSDVAAKVWNAMLNASPPLPEGGE